MLAAALGGCSAEVPPNNPAECVGVRAKMVREEQQRLENRPAPPPSDPYAYAEKHNPEKQEAARRLRALQGGRSNADPVALEIERMCREKIEAEIIIGPVATTK